MAKPNHSLDPVYRVRNEWSLTGIGDPSSPPGSTIPASTTPLFLFYYTYSELVVPWCSSSSQITTLILVWLMVKNKFIFYLKICIDEIKKKLCFSFFVRKFISISVQVNFYILWLIFVRKKCQLLFNKKFTSVETRPILKCSQWRDPYFKHNDN